MKLKEWLRPGKAARTVQTVRRQSGPVELLSGQIPFTGPETALYGAMREAVPIIDAAIEKIVRLTVGFTVECENPAMQKELDCFSREIQVGAGSAGLERFIAVYFDSLLTYGNGVGEMLLHKDGSGVAALYNASLEAVRLERGENPLELRICTQGQDGGWKPAAYPQLILYTPLNPKPGQAVGCSLLRSLPFVTSVLMKIYGAIGQNFSRVANLRYSVTCKPEGSLDRLGAAEIADSLAQQWSEAMSAGENGDIRDFVAVGDVDIKVIGADNQLLEYEVPVRQMLEQIVAKLGLPPFMLGLHWSTTERMSTQQSDILTSELESYRALLEPVILKICRMHLRLGGKDCPLSIRWKEINLQDELEAANVRLVNAQAAKLEREEGAKNETV
ncbi:serine/threonine protein phosphatase [Oscillospiraceae bacterium MB08-C2-2]|nr:serine/threonine protein phosphatase [Oscillospiraceae bacterium MB08-C2-2]